MRRLRRRCLVTALVVAALVLALIGVCIDLGDALSATSRRVLDRGRRLRRPAALV